MRERFHPTLPWPARLETALRLGWIWATVPRLPAPSAPAGVVRGAPPALTVLGIGDSIIAGIGVETQSDSLVAQLAAQLGRAGQEVRWASAGVAGATAAALSGLLGVPVASPPDLVLLSCGVNDVVRGHEAAGFGTALAEFFHMVRARWPGTCVVHAGIPPLESFPALGPHLGRLLGAHGVRCIAAARRAAIGAGALYADFPRDVGAAQFARDGFHPNAAGCAAWAVAVTRTIEESGAWRAARARETSD
jgi:lysophospholipase L1-like esterase